MADRNPSKQRRQAQNRAARQARSARSQAANTPVEDRRVVEPEPSEKPASRFRRSSKSKEAVQAQARAVIESSSDRDDVGTDDEIEATASLVTSQNAPRRGGSPVFSARHRARVALATADQPPARTHVGVVDATGVATVAPTNRSATRTPDPSRQPSRAGRQSVNQPSTTTSSTRTADKSGPRGQGAPPPSSRRPTGASAQQRPLPGFLDRFGGNEPGGRMVMLSFATVLIASIVLNFVHIVPEIAKNSKGKQVQTGEYFTIWHYGVGPGLYFLLPPIVILGLFILTARPWDRRRSWNIALGCLVFITFVTQSISIYVIPIGCLAWGCWQARKAALEEVGGDPRVLREVERERRIEGREAIRAMRGKR